MLAADNGNQEPTLAVDCLIFEIKGRLYSVIRIEI